MTWHGHRLIIFGFLPQNLKTKAVAVGVSVRQGSASGELARLASLGDLAGFRQAFYDCLTLRADALFELTDAVLCADGPVTTLVGLSLTAEHRRGHGALYDGLHSGRIQIDRLRRSLASLPVPRDAEGRIMLAVDVSAWLRTDAATSPDRLFCHVYGRGKGQAQMIPGWGVFVPRGAGAGPHLVDGDPGRGAPRARRRRDRGDRRAGPRGGRAAPAGRASHAR
jgi:hypothetical protein